MRCRFAIAWLIGTGALALVVTGARSAWPKVQSPVRTQQHADRNATDDPNDGDNNQKDDGDRNQMDDGDRNQMDDSDRNQKDDGDRNQKDDGSWNHGEVRRLKTGKIVPQAAVPPAVRQALLKKDPAAEIRSAQPVPPGAGGLAELTYAFRIRTGKDHRRVIFDRAGRPVSQSILRNGANGNDEDDGDQGDNDDGDQGDHDDGDR